MEPSTFPPSDRASLTLQQGPGWDLMQRVKRRAGYNPESCPDGIINLSGAINNGPLAGSDNVLEAAAGFFNRFFEPANPILKDQVVAANGVTSLNNMTVWALCDGGDGILYTTLNFYKLNYDLSVRKDIVTIPVSTSSVGFPFDAAVLIPVLESAIQSHPDVRYRMLFLCNPSNPQGGCYSTKTLETLAAWCAERKMHLVVDEINAMSTFDGMSFSSILTIPAHKNVHCLYGEPADSCGGREIDVCSCSSPHLLFYVLTDTGGFHG
ncbi:pyridoxal phosphate-dependent transferase [Aspergillus venezuelensis]